MQCVKNSPILSPESGPAVLPSASQPRPDKICRQAQQHDPETDRGVQRLLVDDAKCNHATSDDEEESCKRMPGNAKEIAFRFPAIASAKYKYADRSQAKEHHVNGHDVVQNLFE